MSDLLKEIELARQRIAPYVVRTDLIESNVLSKRLGCRVLLKLENLQHTGSFKARGALNKLLSLTDEQRSCGITAASTGNHALAVAYAMKVTSTNGTLYMPTTAAQAKVDKLRDAGVQIQQIGEDPLESELKARDVAKEEGMTYVSPYNDLQVMAGQGTVASEILEQEPGVDAIVVSVGGGGLIGGMAAGGKKLKPGLHAVGVVPANSPAMYDAVRAGHIVESILKPTLSDGTAGRLEEGSITVGPCAEFVDQWIQVEEEEIAQAMAMVFDQHAMRVEGAAGVAVAGLTQIADSFATDAVVAVVICGGNVAPA
ncbi:MAG: pyridoxal-phosphate dependent enzyme [Phycisphaerales bacterium]|nr:pyridoxal-phosphate dependent enzyme [Phycisphaerales bacterium]